MALDRQLKTSLVEVLSTNYPTTDDVEAVYESAGLDRKRDVYWKQPARPLWEDILDLHAVDIEALIDAIQDSGEERVAADLRQVLHGAPEVEAFERLSRAHQLVFSHLDCNREAQWSQLREAVERPPA